MTSTVRTQVSDGQLSVGVRSRVRERQSTASLVAATRSLLLTRAWERISVQLICETAGVSRSTFYAHFDDKQDLLDTVFDALRTHLDGDVVGRDLDAHRSFHFLPALLEHMQGHLPLFERGERSLSGLLLYAQFKRVIEVLVNGEIARSALSCTVSYDLRTFLVGGLFGIVERWCHGGCEQPSEQVLACLDDLIQAELKRSDHRTVAGA